MTQQQDRLLTSIMLVLLLACLAGCVSDKDARTRGAWWDVSDVSSSESWKPTHESLLKTPLKEGFVLVPFDAPMASSAQELDAATQEPLGFAETDVVEHKQTRQYQLFLMVKEQGDKVLVRSLGPNARKSHCIQTRAHVHWDALEIEVWVRKKDLVPILNKKLEYAHNDGTGYRLHAGLPIVRSLYHEQSASPFLINASGVMISPKNLSKENLSLSYPLSALFAYTPKQDVKGTGDLRPRVVFQMFGQSFVRTEQLPRALRRVHESKLVPRPGEEAKEKKEQKMDRIFSLGDGCTQLVVRTSQESNGLVFDRRLGARGTTARVIGVGRGGVLGTRGTIGRGTALSRIIGKKTSPTPKIKSKMRLYQFRPRRNAVVFWRSGAEAGRLTSPDILSSLPAISEQGRACFQPKLNLKEALCIKLNP